MGLGHGAGIVRSGLVLHLDAANTKSYPGSGTAWKDLSGNNRNGVLTNGPSFSSNNKGNFIFDGTNDHSLHSFAPITGNSPLTVTGFFYRTGVTTQKGTWGIGGQTALQGINSYSLNGSNLISIDLWGTATIQSPVAYDLNTWNYCAWVYRGTLFNRTNISIYKNAIEYTGGSLSLARGNETSTPNINSSGIVVGRAGSTDSGYAAPITVSSICFYNRALTSAEIRQNFESSRGRYGI